MKKWVYKKNPYFIIYLNLWFSKYFKIIFLCINGITLFYLSKKKNSTEHFSIYNECIIIRYGMWCKVFDISKVQYVMVTQNIFMKFIQCDHITCSIIIILTHFHILFISNLFHGPWLITQLVVIRLCIPP
jgi:hypothetical protein